MRWRLVNRLKRHWDEWFTFLSRPEVKPDNNDAERALRPIVVHRKVSGGARSDWGAQLVAQMFSFLETMRLQRKGAIAALCELLSLAGRSPPGLEFSVPIRVCLKTRARVKLLRCSPPFVQVSGQHPLTQFLSLTSFSSDKTGKSAFSTPYK